MGGLNQPLAHAQFVSNVVDQHMNIQAAMEEPRFTDRQQLGCRIVIGSRATPSTLQALSKMGHVLQVHGDYTSVMERGQAILHDSKTGINSGASDPRADGLWRTGQAFDGIISVTTLLNWLSEEPVTTKRSFGISGLDI
jgi:gamma-glutamyltranspeptidase/glutathione hydrolase